MTAYLQNLNLQLFDILNANVHLNGAALLSALICAKYLIYLIPLAFVIIWIRGNTADRANLVFAALVASLAMFISYIIGMLAYQPRPFVLGLGHTFLQHAATASFPSHHMTFMWAIGVSLCGSAHLRLFGFITLIMALIVAWARIFLGIHFPFDMLGGIIVATLSYLILYACQDWLKFKILLIIEQPIKDTVQ